MTSGTPKNWQNKQGASLSCALERDICPLNLTPGDRGEYNGAAIVTLLDNGENQPLAL